MRARRHPSRATPAPALPRPRSPRVVVGVALLLLVAVGCRPPDGRTAAATDGVEVSVRVLDEPPTVGPATVEVEIRRDAGPVEAADVTVTGDMTHAGMVPVVDRAEGLGGGRYRTGAFRFTMAGDWVLTVDVALPGGDRRQSALEVRVRPQR